MTSLRVPYTRGRPDRVPSPAAFDELVALVAGVSGRPEQLVADHISDASGRCRGCYSTVAGAPAWPCLLAMIGQAIATGGPIQEPTMWT